MRERIFYSSHGPLPEPDPGRPLIICDVDEVVLGFVAGLEHWLEPLGWRLTRDSYALNGNIRRRDGTIAPQQKVWDLIGDFFAECSGDLSPLPGSIAALTQLSVQGDIIFLSNLPATSASARRANLDHLGLTCPLVVNDGPKGPMLARLASGIAAPVIFLDDSPDQITSAIEEAPDVDTIHLVPDAGFRRHLTTIAGVGLFTGDWDAAARYILDRLETNN